MYHPIDVGWYGVVGVYTSECRHAEVTLDDLKGGDAAENAAMIRAILSGDDRGPRRDAVLLNAGYALFVAAKTNSALEGWELAGSVIDDGTALRKLKELTSV